MGMGEWVVSWGDENGWEWVDGWDGWMDGKGGWMDRWEWVDGWIGVNGWMGE